MQSVPNHGVASGAGSTTSTLGPRQEGGNSYYALAKSPSPSPSAISLQLSVLQDLNTSLVYPSSDSVGGRDAGEREQPPDGEGSRRYAGRK